MNYKIKKAEKNAVSTSETDKLYNLALDHKKRQGADDDELFMNWFNATHHGGEINIPKVISDYYDYLKQMSLRGIEIKGPTNQDIKCYLEFLIEMINDMEEADKNNGAEVPGKLNRSKIHFQDVDSWNYLMGLSDAIYSEIESLEELDNVGPLNNCRLIRLYLLKVFYGLELVDAFCDDRELVGNEEMKSFAQITQFLSEYTKKLSIFMANPCEKEYAKLEAVHVKVLENLDKLTDY